MGESFLCRLTTMFSFHKAGRCRPTPIPENGVANTTLALQGTVTEITCRREYTLPGQETSALTACRDGQWSDVPFSACKGNVKSF